MFCCCGVDSDTSANSSEPYEPPRGDPVVIEPLPDVTALRPSQVSINGGDQTQAAVHPTSCDTSSDASRHPKTVTHDEQPEIAPVGTERIDTQGVMDERLRKRAYILGISDSELQLLPVIFIESFYSCLSPGEVVHLEQRLCDLKTKCTPNKEELSKRLTAPSENFLRSLRPQFSIRNENGFWIDDEIGVQSGLDVRDLILTAADEEIATISQDTMAVIEPYLSIAELEDIRERIELVNISRRAQKEGQIKEEPLSTTPDSVAQSLEPFRPPPVNRDMYHLTATPSVSVEPFIQVQKSNTDSHVLLQPPPKICINDVDAALADNNVEEAVQKIVDDVLGNI
ncbi:hypothetical protein Tcan_06409 [Toxocara canis]|uniref:Uncharacterized protein n=1 Tax=Toxocara canis TaxID=6265 RepID=A0A0B2W3B4_TOXCA|nr:hypothetical protein Tcan_06409 [Toxocara canis]